MNKFIFVILTGLMCFFHDGYAKETKEYQIISIEEMHKEVLFAFLEDVPVEQRSEKLLDNWKENWVVAINEGVKLPLRAIVTGDLFHLDTEFVDSNLIIDKTFYIKFIKNTFLFSEDLKSWKTVDKFFTGEARMSFNQEESNDGLVKLFAEINKR